MSCICVVFEKQIVLRTKRLMCVRNVRCLRSIFWVFRLPGPCTSGSRDFTPSRSSKNHIPPHYVVEDAHRSAKASRGEDLEVQEPVVCRYASSCHFHPTL